VTVGDVMADLRRRRLVPVLTRIEHYLLFPSCRSGPLLSHERLVDLGCEGPLDIVLALQVFVWRFPRQRGRASESSFPLFAVWW